MPQAARSPAARLAGWEQVSTLDDEDDTGVAVVRTGNGSSRTSYRAGELFSLVPLKTHVRRSAKSTEKAERNTADVQAPRNKDKPRPRSAHLPLPTKTEVSGSSERPRSSERRVRSKTPPARREWVALKKVPPLPGPIFSALKPSNGNLPSSIVLESEDSVSSATTPTVTLTRVPVLGSRRCGKTTLVKQFVYCTGSFNPAPTTFEPEYYDPVVTFNDRIYHLRIIDCPALDGKYPSSSFEEWAEYRGWCLRSAAAFLLVFDVTSEKSFQYIRKLRDQIISECPDTPVLLVANKVDGIPSTNTVTLPIVNYGATTMLSCNDAVAASTTTRMNIRREIALLVKKQWKGTVLVECSAKYNWHVLTVFKELMKLLENKEQQSHRPTAARAVQNVLRRNNCSAM
ncbi:unnamed protein product [Echinostoma caproni]|uniref:Ras-like protein family member 10B n=1 Tax=Echinostoma caproni TaxID=27848 RepID=A0A183A6Q3_9TREM|nr:unnamed protein product [Echinostoma caproni]